MFTGFLKISFPSSMPSDNIILSMKLLPSFQFYCSKELVDQLKSSHNWVYLAIIPILSKGSRASICPKCPNKKNFFVNLGKLLK